MKRRRRCWRAGRREKDRAASEGDRTATAAASPPSPHTSALPATMPPPPRSAPLAMPGPRRPSLWGEVSASFLDVAAVAPAELTSPRTAAVADEATSAAVSEPPPLPPAAAAAAAPSPGSARGARMPPLAAARQDHENEAAEVVIVCEPERTSLMMGGLHPRASLYERPVNLDAARAAHAEFRRVMREAGVKVREWGGGREGGGREKRESSRRARLAATAARHHPALAPPQVLTVRDILSYGVDSHMGARVELEDLAMRALSYEVAPPDTEADVDAADRAYLGDDYKRRVLEHMSVGQLIDTILINPTVRLSPSRRDTGFTASYSFQPLSNLVYTRDQQITTCRGVVMGRLRSSQRTLEVDLMRFALAKLGLPVLGGIDVPGFLEGGDFFAAGKGLALLGVGLRSNVDAARQLMDRDLLGTDRLAVVRDDFEQSQAGGGRGGGGAGGVETPRAPPRAHPLPTPPGPHAPRLLLLHPGRRRVPHAGGHDGGRVADEAVGRRIRARGRGEPVRVGALRRRVRGLHAGRGVRHHPRVGRGPAGEGTGGGWWRGEARAARARALGDDPRCVFPPFSISSTAATCSTWATPRLCRCTRARRAPSCGTPRSKARRGGAGGRAPRSRRAPRRPPPPLRRRPGHRLWVHHLHVWRRALRVPSGQADAAAVVE